MVISPNFDGTGYFSEGLAWARDENGKIGFINKKGEWAIKPQFTAAKDFGFKSSMARVKKDEQWGYVSKDGKFITVDAEGLGDFSEGLADGKKDKLVGFFNSKGEWVIKPQFEAVREFHNGFAAARLNGKWGLINTKGEWVVKPVYDSLKDAVAV